MGITDKSFESVLLISFNALLLKAIIKLSFPPTINKEGVIILCRILSSTKSVRPPLETIALISSNSIEAFNAAAVPVLS